MSKCHQTNTKDITGQSANLQPECGEYVSQTKTCEYYEFMRPSQNLWMCITAKKYCEHGWMGTSVFVELAGWNHFNIKLKLWITFQTNWMLTKWSIFRIFSNIETRKYLLNLVKLCSIRKCDNSEKPVKLCSKCECDGFVRNNQP